VATAYIDKQISSIYKIIIKERIKKPGVIFLKCAPKFSLKEWEHPETKVTEEYCLGITQAEG
jgi:hypothetical protein